MTTQDSLTSLGQYRTDVDEALTDLKSNRVVAHIWNHDYTVWKPEPTEISNRLGWLHIAEVMKSNINRMEALSKAVRADGYTHAILLGMGGSSLAPEVFRKTFGVADRYLELAVLDSTDPGAVLAHAESLDLSRTLFIVSTKSGGTVETLSFFKFFYNRVADAVGEENAGEHFVAITDPGSNLADLAKRYDFRAAFLNDSTIGGRYSALSYFGLVPATLVGVDVAKLLDRATDMMSECQSDIEIPPNPPLLKGGSRDDSPFPKEETNPGVWLGVVMSELAIAGRDKLTLLASPPIAAFGAWVEQLIAESTGKEGKGILPVDAETPGPPDVYGDDRLFVYLRLDGDDTQDAAVQALREVGQPVVQIDLRDIYDLGGEYFRWEMATAVAGHRLGINPFDQPNVESAKKLAKDMVSAYKEKGALPTLTPTLQADGITVYGDVEIPPNPPLGKGGARGNSPLGKGGARGNSPLEKGVARGNSPLLKGVARGNSLLKGEARENSPFPSGGTSVLQRVLNSFLAQAKPGDYISLQAYVQPTEETSAILQQLRIRLRDRLKLATTVGYGPRFLHSTGQLHKGDAGKGLFIQFTADDQQDASIPDSPPSIPPARGGDRRGGSSITFGVLKAAQALGDRQALLDAGRRVIRFHLGADVVGGLKRLMKP